MYSFTYDPQPVRVVFGNGSIEQLPEEAKRLGVERALVLSTPGQRALAERAAALLGRRAIGIHAKAVMHVPIETARAAQEDARTHGADAAVAIGGGSTIGLAKAIALETGLPIIALPTTYAGSEMTPIWGLTEGGEKRTGRDPRVLPRCVIYDPALTLGLPPQISGTSGMNAIAHCVEALYAPNRNPVIELMAEEGVRALARSLPAILTHPADLDARSSALYGAWLGGATLGTATLGLHHKLCHTLGGSFNLAHAEVHTVILPHAAAYNAPKTPEAMARIAHALGAEQAPQGLFDLSRALRAPAGLRELGMQHSDLDRAADLATRSPYPNPVPLSRERIRRLLEDAYEGRRPA